MAGQGLVVDALVDGLRPVVVTLLQVGIGLGGQTAAGTVSLGEAEEELRSSGREMIRATMQPVMDVASAAEERVPGGVDGSDGVRRTRVEDGHARNVATVFGRITCAARPTAPRKQRTCTRWTRVLDLPSDPYWKQFLRAARAKDSQRKRHAALQAVQDLEAAGTPITAAVASAAGVSAWLVYADGVREHLQAAQRRQAEQAPSPSATRSPDRSSPTAASLHTDLAIAREQIRRLRAERDHLRDRLRLQLGAEIDGPDRAEPIARLASLEDAHRQLAAERDARAAEADHAQRRIHELEDGLSAARESLRRIIRHTNR